MIKSKPLLNSPILFKKREKVLNKATIYHRQNISPPRGKPLVVFQALKIIRLIEH